jgi:phosphate transport system substrate-binding protein
VLVVTSGGGPVQFAARWMLAILMPILSACSAAPISSSPTRTPGLPTTTPIGTASTVPPTATSSVAPTSELAATPLPVATAAFQAIPREPVLPAGSADWGMLTGTIVIDGSSTVFPITEAAGIEFAGLAPDVQIQLGVSGTGGGFSKFCAGETLISDASRPIKQSEAAACAAAGIDFVELPVAFDGLSVVVQRENDWATCMTLDELKRIWEPAAEGQITSWAQVRTGWPERPLALYGAGRDSGTFDYFTQAIVGEEGAARNDYTASEDDYLLAQDIAANPDGIGFFGYAYYSEYRDQLNLVAVDAGAGCVTPNNATISDGSYQPLSRPIFIYVRSDALDQPATAAFVEYYLSNAARLVTEVRYTPLPLRAYELAAKRVTQRITGSVFNGGSQVGVSIEQLLELEAEKP